MSRMNKIEDLLHKEIANIFVTRIDNQDISKICIVAAETRCTEYTAVRHRGTPIAVHYATWWARYSPRYQVLTQQVSTLSK